MACRRSPVKVNTGRMMEAGFVRATIMEGMIAGAIIVVVAAIVLPYFLNVKQRDYEKQAEAHARHAYAASQALFNRSPKARADMAEVTSYGYQSSPDIQITVTGGRSDLVITARHMKGGRVITIDHKGELSKNE